MKQIPEIHVRNGKVIEDGTGKVLEPIPVFRSLEKILSTDEEDPVFYVVDEDGMERNSFDMGLLERLGEEFRVWFKGGFRRAEFLMDALILGAEVAVMDSSTILSLDELKKACDMSDNVGFSIELQKSGNWNRLPKDMNELSRRLNALNLHSLIFSCEDAPDIMPELFTARKFSTCASAENADTEGVIIPYSLILHRRD